MPSISANARDNIRHDIAENSALDASYMTMTVLASIIASYGLLQGSTAVVIGAMILAPLLGPITGIALALVDGNNRLLVKSSIAEVVGVVAAVAVSLVLGFIYRDLPLTKAVISRTTPNILDLVVALASGAAGAYAVVSPKVLASLVGVAVAASLVPPLCVCGLTLARGQMDMAFGGFLLFFSNLVAIQLASSIVLLAHGFHGITTVMRDDPRKLLLYHAPSALLFVVLAVGLGISFEQTVAQQRLEAKVRTAITEQLCLREGSYLADLRFDQEKDRIKVYAVVRTRYSYDPNAVQAISRKLPRAKFPIELHIRSIITKEATPSGWEGQPEPESAVDSCPTP